MINVWPTLINRRPHRWEIDVEVASVLVDVGKPLCQHGVGQRLGRQWQSGPIGLDLGDQVADALR